MARCPFAKWRPKWRPISGPSGPHIGGPFKFVPHTIDVATAAGAMRS